MGERGKNERKIGGKERKEINESLVY